MISSLETNDFLSIDKNEDILNNIKDNIKNLKFEKSKKKNSTNRIKTIQSIVCDYTEDEEYKKLNALLNNSFWEARSKATNEKIKYPSAFYEKSVKEYQNQYLIDNYNMSLEEIEYRIFKYKEKYSLRIYMDNIYEKALNEIKDKYTLSIDEICDESNGLSLIDMYVRDLLKNDLKKIENQLKDLSDDIIDFEDFKTKYEIDKLNEKTKDILNQLNIIDKRAIFLEKNKGDNNG